MTASRVRARPLPPCARPVCLRAIARAVFRACVSSVPAASIPFAAESLCSPKLTRSPAPSAVELAAAINPPLVLRLLARPARLLHPIFLRVPCRWKFPPNRAPSIPHRVPHIPLPCIWKLPLSQKDIPPAAPASARFQFFPRRLAQSSKYFSASLLRPFQLVTFAAVRDYAVRWPQLSSPLPAQRYICPIPRRFRAASIRQTTELPPPLRVACLREDKSLRLDLRCPSWALFRIPKLSTTLRL